MKYSRALLAFIIFAYFLTGSASATPLTDAALAGDSSAIQKLLNEGSNVNETDKKGYTSLTYAVWSGKSEAVIFLINKGADINAKDKTGYTPVMWALSYSYFDIAKLLINKGADINVKNPEGETVLDLVLSSAKGDILDDIIKAGNINLWVPEAGKARLLFFCSDLYDYIKVTSGHQSKKLDQYVDKGSGAGVAFIDVDSGKHTIDANIEKYVSPNLTSIEVTAGQTYYFKVTQNI